MIIKFCDCLKHMKNLHQIDIHRLVVIVTLTNGDVITYRREYEC